MAANDTELKLMVWRDGATKTERLAAAVLDLAGFKDIDPQAPLGGPDGRKDILCEKGGKRWVAAVYFPNGLVSFANVKKKFKHDLDGPVRHARDGLVFVTNQSLTIGERESLKKIAADVGKEGEIFYLERIRGILDSPSGYGIRIQYLGIGMTVEEQLAWFSESSNRLENALDLNNRELRNLSLRLDRLAMGQDYMNRTLGEVAFSQGVEVSLIPPTPDHLSYEDFQAEPTVQPLTEKLTPSLVMGFHRLTCFDLPSRAVGRFRMGRVHLSRVGQPNSQYLEPISPDQVPELIEKLCKEWSSQYSRLATAKPKDKLRSIANFHAKFLMIHPFEDGNGRAARAILMQQTLDMFGVANMSLLDRGAAYYTALQAADEGNIELLATLIAPVAGIEAA
ncbi:Fic family protein [Azospirillum thiophilum]|uniref:Fic family protein n=1 Tax=Azospirillum thiophilum TaxID=528244 RepID=UPI000A3DA33B|nr:Fic family protein [Azospirillum thiophilum]